MIESKGMEIEISNKGGEIDDPAEEEPGAPASEFEEDTSVEEEGTKASPGKPVPKTEYEGKKKARTKQKYHSSVGQERKDVSMWRGIRHGMS